MAVTNKTPYFYWECYKHGMFKSLSEIENYDYFFNKSIELLSNQNLFFENGLKMVFEWKISSRNFLTNQNINKIAYIGQASCCFFCGSPEIITKQAWKCIPDEVKNEANNTAKKILSVYEARSSKIHSQMEIQWI